MTAAAPDCLDAPDIRSRAEDWADTPTLVAPTDFECLVADAVCGDRRARDLLLGQIHPFVLRYCRARLGRQESVVGSADDVAQEVCLAVVRALPSYSLKGLSFRAFVYGIASHKVTDAFRTLGRNRTDSVSEVPDAPCRGDEPESRLLAWELNGQVCRLLEILTPRQREVLVLRLAVGLSAEETAVAVNSTPGAVRVTQHRALNRLRAALGTGPGPQTLDQPVIPAQRRPVDEHRAAASG